MAVGAFLVEVFLLEMFLLAATASPAAAHGVGGRQDLPLPAWQVAWGAGIAVVISFAALGLLWTRPRLRAAADGRLVGPPRRNLLDVATVAGRVVVLALFVVILGAALFGSDNSAENVAPVALYVAFWVGVPVLAVLVGDVWSAVDPLATLARVIPRRRTVPGATETDPDPGVRDGAGRDARSVYPAAVVLGAFAWLELAYHDPSSPRAVGVFLVATTLFVVGGAVLAGPPWVDRSNGFAVFFRLLAHLAPPWHGTTPAAGCAYGHRSVASPRRRSGPAPWPSSSSCSVRPRSTG